MTSHRAYLCAVGKTDAELKHTSVLILGDECVAYVVAVEEDHGPACEFSKHVRYTNRANTAIVGFRQRREPVTLW